MYCCQQQPLTTPAIPVRATCLDTTADVDHPALPAPAAGAAQPLLGPSRHPLPHGAPLPAGSCQYRPAPAVMQAQLLLLHMVQQDPGKHTWR
jgi:hypothetical protein